MTTMSAGPLSNPLLPPNAHRSFSQLPTQKSWKASSGSRPSSTQKALSKQRYRPHTTGHTLHDSASRRRISISTSPTKSPDDCRPSISLSEHPKGLLKRRSTIKVAAPDLFLDDDYDFDRLSDDEVDTRRNITYNPHLIYETACKHMKCLPLYCFIKQQNKAICKVSNKLLTNVDAKAIAIALMSNSTVQSFDISGNDLGHKGAEYMSEVLRENNFITELNLSSTNPGKQGIKVLAAALQDNKTLRTLNLSDNQIDIAHSRDIASIISNNEYLQDLNLSYNKLGDDGGRVVGPAIGDNVSLNHLSLRWNHLRMGGAVSVCSGILNNSRLQSIDLSWNGFGIEGATGVAMALEKNQTLKEINLDSNRINMKALKALMDGLVKNDTLHTLKLDRNPITTDGAILLLKYLKESSSCAIRDIDIADTPVDNEFLTKFEELKATREIHIKHGTHPRMHNLQAKKKNEDDSGFDKYDPLMILFHYMQHDKMRLIDLFQRFDKDKDMVLTRGEIKAGLLEVNIPISDEALENMLKILDTDFDGTVDISELKVGHQNTRRKMTTILQALRKKNKKPFDALQLLIKKAINDTRYIPDRDSRRSSIATNAFKKGIQEVIKEEDEKLTDVPDSSGLGFANVVSSLLTTKMEDRAKNWLESARASRFFKMTSEHEDSMKQWMDKATLGKRESILSITFKQANDSSAAEMCDIVIA